MSSPLSKIASLGRPFWMLCTMEMWERLAYYGLRVVVGVYIAQADVPGGLHWTQADRAQIFFWWSIFQSVLPTFTGGIADRYGYKRTIFVSITLKLAGYLVMGSQREYWPFFLGAMLLATGTALFKPGIQGSLAHNLKKEDSSLGWGIFYWLVNVGAMIGPPFAGWLRGENSWPQVFYGCAAIVSLNYGMLFTYREPESGYDTSKSFGSVMADTFSNFFEPRLLAFLAIMTGFWLMMYQLWDFHPFFITDWVDSRSVADTLSIPDSWIEPGSTRGRQIGQEHILNLNAALIVLLVVPISWAVQKLRTLEAMLGGMVMATIGILVSGLTTSGWILLLGVLAFSLGEMLTGPKKSEYLGAIAPPGKKGLYLGYVNIPVGVGQAIGAQLTAWLYGNWGEKAMLAQRYLAEHPDLLGRDVSWDGDVSTLEAATGVSRETAMTTLCDRAHLDAQAATDLLWTTYSPWVVWLPIAAIGLVSVVALVMFNRAAKRWSDMNP
ncbi:MAG: MFS transporter [Deltaproteobacteria bacterium]|nr:MFS transporter [Deltaproteobacteria bacterium]